MWEDLIVVFSDFSVLGKKTFQIRFISEVGVCVCTDNEDTRLEKEN